MPYQRMGHYFLAAVYAVMLYVSSSMYGSLRLGYFRNGGLTLYPHDGYQLRQCSFANIPIVLLVKHFKTVMPLVLMTAGQFVIICILGISGKWNVQEAVSAQKGDHDIWRTPGGGSYE